MKKSLFFLVFISLFLTACPPPPKYQFQEISYKSITRGKSERIKIQRTKSNYSKAKLVYLKNNKKVLNEEFKKKNFKDLYQVVKNIDLNTINQLQVPSKKHQYDGAMYTTIEIKKQGEVYRSVGFDHDNPPKELKKLVDYLQNLIK